MSHSTEAPVSGLLFSELSLDPMILKAIELSGYKMATPIQAASIPHILNGDDIVATAPTGTGKTASFVLPALQRLSISPFSQAPRVLILTPTRELAQQICKATAQYGKFLKLSSTAGLAAQAEQSEKSKNNKHVNGLPIKITTLVGGMPYPPQLRALRDRLDIIVATPGRLMDHIERGTLDLSHIEMLVLDEADRMLDMGFEEDVKRIIKQMPKNRQTLLFSATVDQKLASIIKQVVKNPVTVNLSQEKLSPAQIEQSLYVTDNEAHKQRIMMHLFEDQSIFKTIIFCATKIHTEKLANDLRHAGFSAAAINGDLRQSVRDRTLKQLREGRIQILVATDVAARGIDVSDITHVLNFDLPRSPEDYVHRIGRTGRAGKTGIAISFASPQDGLLLQRIERYVSKTIPRLTIEGLEPKSGSLRMQESAKRGRGKSNNSGYKKGPQKSYGGYRKDNAGSGNDKYHGGGNNARSQEQRSSERGYESRQSTGGFGDHKKRFHGESSSSERTAFKSERPARTERSEFKSDRPAFRTERSAFRTERSESRSERPGFKSERPSFKKERPAYGNSSYSERGSAPTRSHESRYGEKRSASSRGGNASEFTVPQTSWGKPHQARENASDRFMPSSQLPKRNNQERFQKNPKASPGQYESQRYSGGVKKTATVKVSYKSSPTATTTKPKTGRFKKDKYENV